MSRIVDSTPTTGTLAQVVIPAAFNPDGGLQALAVDADGKLYVTSTGGGGGGTSSTDGATFTAGVSAGTPIMAEDPTSGDLLVAKMVAGTRNLEVGIAGIVPVSGAVTVSGSVTTTPVTSSTATSPAVNTVDGTAETVLAANSSRKRFMLQNVGTTKIYIAFGATPTTSNYHLALPAGGSQNDGSSPVYTDEMWTGNVQAISSAAGGLLQITEMT